MATYTDDELDFWGEVFTGFRIYQRFGIEFELFMLDPSAVLAMLYPSHGMALILPRQLQVMRRELQRQLEESLVPTGARLRGAGYMERLRHHSWATSHTNHFNLRTRA